MTEPVLSLFSFRHNGGADRDAHNIALVNAINEDGRIYLTQTRVDGAIAIRFQAGSFEMTEGDIEIAFEAITEIAGRLSKPHNTACAALAGRPRRRIMSRRLICRVRSRLFRREGICPCPLRKTPSSRR